MKKTLFIALVASLLGGCYTVPQQQTESVGNADKLTVGKVQQSISEGMTQAEVLQSLGSPNIVTRDRNGVETWAYDKHSTDVYTVKNGEYASLILVGVSGNASDTKTTQRTLTLILKFKQGVLKEFSYNSTSF